MPDRTEPPAEKPEANVAESASGALFESCHSPADGWGALQATARALREQSIIVKGSKALLSLDDFDATDAIFVAGQSPGTNSPRMMTSLRNAGRRGVRIVAINPLRDRALERFTPPQDPIEMLTLSSTPVAHEYCQVKVGGDVALLQGMMKLILEQHEAALASGAAPILDIPFIERHTLGLRGLTDDVRATSWTDILRVSGVPCEQIERLARIHVQAARGSAAAYCPETNDLLPLSHHDARSKTPSAKSIPVLIRPMRAADPDSMVEPRGL